MKSLKAGDSVDVLITNHLTSFIQKDNKVLCANNTKIVAQMNAPNTSMHLSTMEFDKNVNKNTVVGYGGKSTYSLL